MRTAVERNSRKDLPDHLVLPGDGGRSGRLHSFLPSLPAGRCLPVQVWQGSASG